MICSKALVSPCFTHPFGTMCNTGSSVLGTMVRYAQYRHVQFECVLPWVGVVGVHTLKLFWDLQTFLLRIRDDKAPISPLAKDMQNFFNLSVPVSRWNEGNDKWHIREIPENTQPPLLTISYRCYNILPLLTNPMFALYFFTICGHAIFS
jgi:hypothetical protein